MPRLIKTWDELDGLESENYKIKLDNNNNKCSGWIIPKDESKFPEEEYWDHHEYLSTHTFYGEMHQISTKTLQHFGFDVEIDNWDKGDE